jgi:putative MATE family efflux protein
VVLTSERRRRILDLALPIIGGMASQNVLNLVDTAMVGLLGASALAAVGMGSFANFMASAFIMGLSAGVQAMAARRLGEGRTGETAVPLNGGLLLALVLALPWSLVLVAFADLLFPFLIQDPDVVVLGVPYLRARLVAMAALGMNFAFRGYWNGVNLSKVYMRTLIVMHASNIFLNWVLIFGHLGLPALGCTGAGIGSAIATFLGTFVYLVQALRLARRSGFLRGLPDRHTMATMLRLSVPAGIQQFFFAAGMTAFFWIIGRVGTAELAASNVLVHLLLVAILPGMGFGMASASLVGQALGRGDPKDARQWGWDVAKLAMVLVGSIASIGLVFPDLLLRFFLHDPETLDLARLPLRVVAAAMWFDTLGLVLLNSLLGAGDTRRVMAVSVSLQWCLFLPAAYAIGPVLGLGMTGVWLAQVAYRSLQTVAFVGLWRGGRWAQVEV